MPRLDGDEDPEAEWLRSVLGPEGDSRRGRALAAAAALEDLLEQLIDVTLIRHPEHRSNLGPAPSGKEKLHQKIENAKRVGGIDAREALQCEVIRLVRNKFAHDPQASFYRGTELADIVGRLGDPPHPNLRKRGSAPLDGKGADLAHYFIVVELLPRIRRRLQTDQE